MVGWSIHAMIDAHRPVWADPAFSADRETGKSHAAAFDGATTAGHLRSALRAVRQVLLAPVAACERYREHRRMVAAVMALDDRLLRDIGVLRDDLIHDPAGAIASRGARSESR